MVDSKLGWVAVAALVMVAAGCGGDDDDNANDTGSGGAHVADGTGGTDAGSGGTNAGASGKGGSGGSSAMTGSGGMGNAGMGNAGTGMAGTGSGGMAAGSGGTSSSGTGTSPSPADPPDISTCMPPPASASDAAKTAFMAVNSLRLKTGAGCAVMVEALNASSTNHCEYYAANKADSMCVADPHGEVESCMKFTGTGPGQRMQAAGYTGRGGGSEVMAFNNDPQAAVDQWINSVWHRIPLLDPWTAEFGYGAADGCDVIDLGRGTPAADTTVTVYPYDGQVDVPTSFDGSHEGPMPPAPPTGWPSGSPINVYAKMLDVTEHTVTKDGDATPLEHVWLTSADSQFLRSGAMIYTNAPFMPMTKYRVKVVGTAQSGPLDLEWTFTTGAAPRWPRQ
jgi:uncharacterized protein YkwD